MRRAETEAKAGWAEAAGWRAVQVATEATWAEVGWAWGLVEMVLVGRAALRREGGEQLSHLTKMDQHCLGR